MRITETINYKGVALDCTGDYYEGSQGSREEPPEPYEFEIETVEFEGKDITDVIIAFDLFKELENKYLTL